MIAVVEDAGFLERFLKVRDELPHLERIFVIEPPELSPDDVQPYDALRVGDAGRPRRARRGHGTRRPRHRHLHVGDHRSAEGRDAHASTTWPTRASS